MKRGNKFSWLAWACAAGLLCSFVASAEDAPHPTLVDGTLFPAPVSNARLASMRGGFDLGNGLLASFGISRMVYINGNLVSQTTINVPDLANITADQANALATALGSVNVIRNGPGNSVAPDAMNNALGATVIQNTLDNQEIKTMTTINASLKVLNQFNGMNLNNSVQSAVINSRGQ